MKPVLTSSAIAPISPSPCRVIMEKLKGRGRKNWGRGDSITKMGKGRLPLIQKSQSKYKCVAKPSFCSLTMLPPPGIY